MKMQSTSAAAASSRSGERDAPLVVAFCKAKGGSIQGFGGIAAGTTIAEIRGFFAARGLDPGSRLYKITRAQIEQFAANQAAEEAYLEAADAVLANDLSPVVEGMFLLAVRPVAPPAALWPDDGGKSALSVASSDAACGLYLFCQLYRDLRALRAHNISTRSCRLMHSRYVFPVCGPFAETLQGIREALEKVAASQNQLADAFAGLLKDVRRLPGMRDRRKSSIPPAAAAAAPIAPAAALAAE